MKNNVIGPINSDDWNVLLFLKEGLKRMRKDPAKYRNIIQEDLELYNKYVNKYVA